ncbi:hypothetical protein AWW72_14135 [Acinetobacter sp. NRRL B-65365]|uniref:hypothetical protein n=1 Tax=Acinetobacter sp. NRRL B-65365 TaxID=1785092 RepID=UPI0007A04C0B|nr:hypothetical protein [Acinetobacter sp. NRRL B-65365]KYQ83479.1 hypothetical protein AWW72_14135 [Acinetobacter sp. NRRL B-65365]
MNNILNAQEAFAALQKGKTVLCRYAGDGVLHADKDFSALDQMPATVFGLPNYEFCIQLEMLELAGIKFTKPCTIDELEKGQEIYVCIFPCAEIHKTKFNNSSDVLNFIRCGVVQRDEENAELQMKAYHAFLGLDLALTINGVPDTEKKQTGKRPTKKEIEAHKDVILDAIATCVDTNEVETVCSGIEQYGFNDDQIQAINNAKCAKLELLTAYTPALTELEPEAPEIIIPNEGGHYFDKVKAETAAWNGQLQELLARLPETKTPEEANALVRYTKSWTEDQRQPLLRAISRRLQEFQNPLPKAEPSLMVKIQNAPDLTTLDALEIDVSGLDPIAQPDMMRIVNTRRLQLESAANDEGQAS